MKQKVGHNWEKLDQRILPKCFIYL